MRKVLLFILAAIALIGVVTNLDVIFFSIIQGIITLAVIAGIIYLVYYFFFLTEDQRKYKRAQRKYRKRQRQKNK